MIGATAALHVSHIPFLQPTGAVRVGRINGELVAHADATRSWRRAIST